MCSNAKSTVVLFTLLASFGTSAFGATCTKLNAMQESWDTSLSIPITLNRTTYEEFGNLTDSLTTMKNYTRLSLHGEFTFNNRSILTKGTFHDLQCDEANSLGVIEYDKAPRGVTLNTTKRNQTTKKPCTKWRKAK